MASGEITAPLVKETPLKNKNQSGIKQLPESERPYERCLEFGPDALSDTELVAIVLRSGTRTKNSLELARELLSMSEDKGGLANLLHSTVSDLTAIPGIGTVKAVQLRCIGELARRLAKSSLKRGDILSSPSGVADYFMEDMRHLKQEEIFVAMFDTRNRLIHSSMISRGTVNSSLLTPREVFIEALKYGAVSIILLHNHPSGDPAPSKEDLLLTRRMREAGSILNIPVIDHVIIGDNKYCSFKESGYL